MKTEDFKKKLAAAGMSRPRFARLVGVQQAEVDAWMSGDATPPHTVATLLTLIAGLDLPAETVFEIISGKPTISPAAQLRALQRTARQISQAALAKVADLEAKLWGGLSVHAVKELEALVASEMTPVDGRLAGAYELARWQIHTGDYGAALANLRVRLALNPQRAPRKEAILLEFAALTALGHFDEAREAIDRGLRRQGGDGDLCIARNNLLFAVDPSDARSRLAALNEMYESHSLAPLHIARGAPFEMRNLRAYAPEAEAHPDVKISVLMAAFNASDHLRMSIDSILAQTHHNIEVIVVDDCSQDDTFHVASDIATADDRVRVFKNEVNRGAYLTRNRALELAEGDVVTVHDSDDWSHPQMLELQLAALLTNQDVRGTFSAMARATDQMIFKVRPHRRRSEYLHRSFPSLMMRKADVEALGGWDGVRANADAEFVRRARASFGEQSLVDVLPDVALSFFTIRPESLTEQSDTSLLSLTFGVRREYNAQSDYHSAVLKEQGAGDGEAINLPPRSSKKAPFPSPENLLPEEMRTDRRYHLLIVGDLAHDTGRLQALLHYASIAVAQGARVAAFHWPDAEQAYAADIWPTFRELNEQPGFDIVTYEEAFDVDYVMFCRPEVLRYAIDGFPTVSAQRAGILVGETELRAGDLLEIRLMAEALLGLEPEWLPVSPAARERVANLQGNQKISPYLWHPPLSGTASGAGRRSRDGRAPVLGRIGSDSMAAWPSDPAAIKSAFCVNTVIDVEIWGGSTVPEGLLRERPRNWKASDAADLSQFLAGIDFLSLFEGQSKPPIYSPDIAEAMGAGIPILADQRFKPIYGDAAIYVDAADVYKTIQGLWFDATRFEEASSKARAFADARAGGGAVEERLRSILKVQSATGRKTKKPASPTSTLAHHPV